MVRSSIENRKETLGIFYRSENKSAATWAKKIYKWVQKKYPNIKVVSVKPKTLIVLGGDGSILEAVGKYKNYNPVIIGLNLGRTGFLASVREPKKFISGLDRFLKNRFRITDRIMLEAIVLRKNKKVFSATALNDVVVNNLLGVSEIEVKISNHPIQYVRGSGVLVATAGGSTAYNLSAHGPIIMPHMQCFVISELLDHNIPTPSIVIDSKEEVKLKIIDFRKHELLSLTKNGKGVDMLLSADGATIFPITVGDVVKMKKSKHVVRFAELEKNYFFKSLQEKFAFR